MSTPAASDNLTMLVEPSTGILRVVWARPLLTAGLIDSYYELLEHAALAGCRYWHLDLRMRIWPAATFMHWLIDTFAALATQRLQSPIYVACWVSERHQPHIDDPLTVNMRQQVAKLGFYLSFFNKEPDARAWLLKHQAAFEKKHGAGGKAAKA